MQPGLEALQGKNLASHISFQMCTLLNNALWAMSNLTYCYVFYI